MTDLDEKICEQLCAWMDGELSADEARFLERRLAGDAALRAKWERLQLASSCLKGQPLRPMPASLAANVQVALADAPARSRRAWLGWAAAASVAALAIAIAPRLGRDSASTGDFAAAPVAAPVNVVATPASADLVAVNAVVPAAPGAKPATDASAVSAAAPSRTPRAADAVLAVAAPAPSRQESPLPLDAQSPTDFPLVETSAAKSWPRSPLSAPADDPALEAYLVRHNQMMSGDGLGGFVPYVDVVASDKSEAAGTADGGEGEAQ